MMYRGNSHCDRGELDEALIDLSEAIRLGPEVASAWYNRGNVQARKGELEKAIAGISQRMLTLTLKHLVEDGLVARTAYAEVPPRVEYETTELGKTLVPLVIQ